MTLVTLEHSSVAEYHHLIELGFVQANERIELIIQMAAKGMPPSVCNTLLFGELFTLLQRQATIGNQALLTLALNKIGRSLLT